MQPSSSMKYSFSPARSSVAEGTLPADPYFAFLDKLATFQSGRKCERQGLCQNSSGEWKSQEFCFVKPEQEVAVNGLAHRGGGEITEAAPLAIARQSAWLPLNKRRKFIYTFTIQVDSSYPANSFARMSSSEIPE